MKHAMRTSALVLAAVLAVGPVAAQEVEALEGSVASETPSAQAMDDLNALLVEGEQPPVAGEDGVASSPEAVQEVLDEAASEAVQEATPVIEEAVEGAVEAAVEEALAPAVEEAVEQSLPQAVEEALDGVASEAVEAAPEAAPTLVEPETVPAESAHGLYEEIGSAGDWTAIRFEPTAERTVCAIFSRPTDSIITEDGNAIAALRGERAAFITWESGRVVDTEGVFSAIIGAPLDTPFDGHSFATDTETFPLFGDVDRLYVNADADVAAIAAIRKGLTLTLTAALPGGRLAQDTYSLRGVQASTELAKEACATGG